MILELRNICKKYRSGGSSVEVLRNFNISIDKGESVGLVGPSGIGKSTILHIAGLLDRPNSGDVIINGKVTGNLSDNERTMLRRKNIGFVYQFHNLLPEFTALENVMLPCLVDGYPRKRAMQRAEDLLNQVGLAERIHYTSKVLSGGEQQRVAIARALSNDPELIIADEPTGNLDPSTAEVIFELFTSLVRNKNTAFIMATHNVEFANRLDSIVRK
ncbi:MAG: ABC transporter ATP-binding protein [Holosporales bacterium]|jgi:lipoprotein-releasing system ATP-binding protein|nr:ABC transporter ATP-binding protein [Holosporales bacterium]